MSKYVAVLPKNDHQADASGDCSRTQSSSLARMPLDLLRLDIEVGTR
jgi:hypothetical protein